MLSRKRTAVAPDGLSLGLELLTSKCRVDMTRRGGSPGGSRAPRGGQSARPKTYTGSWSHASPGRHATLPHYRDAMAPTPPDRGDSLSPCCTRFQGRRLHGRGRGKGAAAGHVRQRPPVTQAQGAADHGVQLRADLPGNPTPPGSRRRLQPRCACGARHRQGRLIRNNKP